MTGWLFSPGTPVSSTNETDRHDLTKILLKSALNTITLTTVRKNRRSEETKGGDQKPQLEGEAIKWLKGKDKQ